MLIALLKPLRSDFFQCRVEKNLEEVLLLEAVGSAGLEVHLDVLPLLERSLHRVDLLH